MLPWIAAVLLGAFVPALVMAVIDREPTLLPLAFAVTLAHALILGLPVALLYSAKRWTRFSAAIASAALVAAMPGGLIYCLMLAAYPSKELASAGWANLPKLLAMVAGLGAIGGAVFWLCLKLSGALVADPGAAKPTTHQRLIGAFLAGIAIVASATTLALPSITMDRSCHNVFRDGEPSPKVRLELNVETTDWPRLTQLFENFATTHNLSLRNSSEKKPAVEILGLNACNEQGVVVTAQKWAAVRDIVERTGDRPVYVNVFDLGKEPGWQPIAKDLVATLTSEWREKVRFRDGIGRIVPTPDMFAPQADSAPSQ